MPVDMPMDMHVCMHTNRCTLAALEMHIPSPSHSAAFGKQHACVHACVFACSESLWEYSLYHGDERAVQEYMYCNGAEWLQRVCKSGVHTPLIKWEAEEAGERVGGCARVRVVGGGAGRGKCRAEHLSISNTISKTN